MSFGVHVGKIDSDFLGIRMNMCKCATVCVWWIFGYASHYGFDKKKEKEKRAEIYDEILWCDVYVSPLLWLVTIYHGYVICVYVATVLCEMCEWWKGCWTRSHLKANEQILQFDCCNYFLVGSIAIFRSLYFLQASRFVVRVDAIKLMVVRLAVVQWIKSLTFFPKFLISIQLLNVYWLQCFGLTFWCHLS